MMPGVTKNMQKAFLKTGDHSKRCNFKDEKDGNINYEKINN